MTGMTEQEEIAMNTNRKEPDCYTCIRWDECENAVAGKFCPMWQSKEPEPKGEDPNDAWNRGDDWDE